MNWHLTVERYCAPSQEGREKFKEKSESLKSIAEGGELGPQEPTGEKRETDSSGPLGDHTQRT